MLSLPFQVQPGPGEASWTQGAGGTDMLHMGILSALHVAEQPQRIVTCLLELHTVGRKSLSCYPLKRQLYG